MEAQRKIPEGAHCIILGRKAKVEEDEENENEDDDIDEDKGEVCQ